MTNPRVLLVEDEVISQKLVCALLAKLPVEVTVVATAEEAHIALAENKYELIILDVQLPGISGIELAKEIRSSEKGGAKHTLIVALTGMSSEEDRKACIESGMDGFFSKPLNRMKFHDFLKKVLK